ncbi:LRR receptor-like serine/threonine-protein kinase RPK2 [Pistacia vera]|uniref:LRR receptor-like serine/threonine-protein kinase RPK2 n=1 Tax=Pistacia vera TaxID=55513 RepID=UPI00126395F5|nr:LRR receptor-like serine/threonine-protein kinase RPK2 [Pistacia vera]
MKTLICLLLFCFTLPFSPTDAYYFSSDLASLLSFKNSVSRDPSNLLATWNSTTDHCTWFGVTCDRFTGRVTGLALVGAVTSSSNVIAGTLPASISELAELRTLSIPHNVFSGQIPASIGELRFLEVVELQGNNFSGEIPYEISKLEALRVLNLSFNLLSGGVPRRVIGGGNLSVIDLSNNQLAGGVVIDSVSKCEFLEHLKLSNNFLTENIPKEIGKCRNLRTLMLDGNILEGPIPAEIGRISELRVLDVSRNSLTDRIPVELANCRKLSVVALTNLNEVNDNDGSLKGEFNAFDGGVPYELLMSSSLQILWAPRGNLGGRLPDNWNDSCSLRVLNLGQNGFNGVLPKSLGNCKNLTYLDLSLNNLVGYLPMQLRVPCMMYFNVSQNNITGVLTRHEDANCGSSSLISFGDDFSFLDLEDVQIAYANIPFWVSTSNKIFVIIHDFSSNRFSGTLPVFALGDEFMASKSKPVYRLLLNNNMFNESLPGELVSNCSDLLSLSVNLSANQLSGMIDKGLFLNCLTLMEFEAANNQIGGPIASGVDKLMKLQRLDLSGNRVSGSLPYQLGKLKFLKWIFLGGNNITGEIPSEFGKLSSLTVLDLSHNVLTGSIPASLSNATALETLLLDHNQLSGEIPSSFSTLLSLATLDISFNNLSGRIPHLHHQIDCNSFNENKYLGPCPDTNSTGPEKIPVQLSHDRLQSRKRLKSFIIAVVTSASAVLCIASVIVFVIFRRRRFRRLASLRGKVVVTFAETPTELTYDNVVRATGNFSIGNLIGTGGFGSTYKAELVPGYLVAVKKLYLGRFQGIQQFDAEIRTLGRIRHKNLVTLIGYYVGEAEMFLIYNYLSGGNLDTFIHKQSGKNVQWSVILNIAIDIAQALAYLHYSCVPRIVHRDIKPSNILLDEELNAYLSDFGLARLLEVSETHATTDVAGTFGYVAPEYATTCRVSDKADVYSFGVVLLELMSGKKSLDPSFFEYGNGFNIVSWAKMLMKEGRSSELFSPALWEAGPKENLLGMLRLATGCTVETLSVRPSVKQVLEKLKQLK